MALRILPTVLRRNPAAQDLKWWRPTPSEQEISLTPVKGSDPKAWIYGKITQVLPSIFLDSYRPHVGEYEVRVTVILVGTSSDRTTSIEAALRKYGLYPFQNPFGEDFLVRELRGEVGNRIPLRVYRLAGDDGVYFRTEQEARSLFDKVLKTLQA